MTDPSRRILVVDDYAPSRYTFRRILGADGFEVVEAGDGAGAREALAQPLALVVLDVNLPDVDGIELCRQIRSSHPDLPVILISASYRAREEQAIWESAGAQDFLEQPIDATHLLETVRRLIGP